jgi:hypothetical protein
MSSKRYRCPEAIPSRIPIQNMVLDVPALTGCIRMTYSTHDRGVRIQQKNTHFVLNAPSQCTGQVIRTHKTYQKNIASINSKQGEAIQGDGEQEYVVENEVPVRYQYNSLPKAGQ